MNTKTQNALKMAIEALQNIDNWLPTIGQRGLRDYEYDALQACKDALEQPSWQGLSDEEISLMAFNTEPEFWNSLVNRECWHEGFKAGVHALEMNLKEQA